MAYLTQKLIIGAFAIWGAFTMSGAHLNWWQAPQATETAQHVRVAGAPSTNQPPLTVAPPQYVTTTTITTIANCGDVQRLAVSLGWPKTELATLIRVVKAESGCYPWAHNVSDPNGGSIGLMQINGFWCLPNKYWPIGWLQAHGLVDNCDDLFNATLNLKAGLAIWQTTGWHAWSTF